MNAEPTENVIPVRPIQVRLARLGIVGALLLFLFLQLFGGATVSVETQGEITRYTAQSSMDLVFLAFPVLTGILAIVYSLQPGIFRLFGAVFVLMTAGLTYTAFTMDTSNHYVQVSPAGIIREVGTTRKPLRHEIEFANTTFLYIGEVPGDRGPRYELVAKATDGTETRIPIFDMMRAALPEIMETARRQGVAIGESETGEVIPAALLTEADK